MSWTVAVTNQAGGLTQEQMEGNALMIRSFLSGSGWSLNAICAVCGNFQHESYLNPGQWQIGHPVGGNTGGVGLGQWTPPSHLRDWMNLNSYNLYDGDRQLEYLNLNNIYVDSSYLGSQWNTSASPNWTWNYFKTSSDSVNDCTRAFFNQWEQVGDSTLGIRQEYARKWYEFFQGKPEKYDIPACLLYCYRKKIINRKVEKI